MRRRTFLKSMLGTAAWLFAGGGRAHATPLIVATTVSRSGPYASFAEPIEQGLTLWAESADRSAAFAGHGVELRILDDASQPEQAQAAFDALLQAADAMIAPYGSRLTEAVLPLVEESGVPCVAPSAGSRDLWSEPRSWTVQLLNPVDTTFASMLELVAGEGARSVALVYRDDGFSRLVMDGAERTAAALGMEVTARRRFTIEAEAAAALDGLTADVLLATGYRPDGAGFGFVEDALMLHTTLARRDPAFAWVNLGIGAAGRDFGEAAQPSPDRVFGTTGWRSYLPTPGNRDFVKRYTRQWGAPPDTHAAQAYAAGQLLAEAWRQVGRGSLAPSSAPSSAPPREAWRDALFGLDTETVFGRFAVDANGLQIAKQNAVIQWHDRQPEVLFPLRYRTAALPQSSARPIASPTRRSA